MKYIISAFFFLTFIGQANSQNINFTLADPQPVIQEVYGGRILSGDFDNDGDMDLVQSGIGLDLMGLSARVSVFLNDGDGNFTFQEQNFNNFMSTEEIALADFDNDNDLDILVTAINRSDLYLNDRQANFIFSDNIALEPISFSEIIVGDVDGDGNLDVVQFGEPNTSLSPPIANLYFNDGSGVFTLSPNNAFTPLRQPTVKFIDLEGDGDLDIISFGENEDAEPAVGVYENDGSGNYTIFSNSNIAPHLSNEISVGDIDNDGDEDVLITGLALGNIAKTILYLNNGTGEFSELMDTSFPDFFAGTSEFTDLDDDNDLDILLIGSMDGGLPNIFSIVFENLGNNNFVAADSLGGEYIVEKTIADFNGDNKKDIIIQGFVDDTNIYWNESIFSSVQLIADNSILVSPNPTTKQIQIKCKEGAFNKIEIFDQQGRIINSQLVDGANLHNIEIDAPSGIYLLKMSGKKGISTQKIVVTE